MILLNRRSADKDIGAVPLFIFMNMFILYIYITATIVVKCTHCFVLQSTSA